MNYIFYVSDVDEGMSGVKRKLETERAIAKNLSQGMDKCIIKKCSEYSGEYLDCDSVGLVFPSYRWGLSLSVYAFVQRLRVSSRTYVYAVASGESISGSVSERIMSKLTNLEQFRYIFEKKGLGSSSDIYVRCIDRGADCIEEQGPDGGQDIRINMILQGLLYKTLDTVVQSKPVEKRYILDTRQIRKQTFSEPEGNKKISKENHINSSVNLSNVFLDDEILAGVSLCRVI